MKYRNLKSNIKDQRNTILIKTKKKIRINLTTINKQEMMITINNNKAVTNKLKNR